MLKLNANVRWTYGDGDPEEAITITGRWAFSVTAPEAVTQATLLLAEWLYHRKDNPADRDENKTSRHGVPLVMADLPDDVRELLIPLLRH
jgi:hypothetical protein